MIWEPVYSRSQNKKKIHLIRILFLLLLLLFCRFIRSTPFLHIYIYTYMLWKITNAIIYFARLSDIMLLYHFSDTVCIVCPFLMTFYKIIVLKNRAQFYTQRHNYTLIAALDISNIGLYFLFFLKAIARKPIVKLKLVYIIVVYAMLLYAK